MLLWVGTRASHGAGRGATSPLTWRALLSRVAGPRELGDIFDSDAAGGVDLLLDATLRSSLITF